ncbi:MAG: glycosyl hydrolase 53 family protein [Lachnospiraceae bacterium]|nr:glycosyl hydrolase 53 family protein [Lachnospiraceae bacterium]
MMRKKLNHFLSLVMICSMIGISGCGNTEEQPTSENVESESVNVSEEQQTVVNERTKIEAITYDLPTEAEEAGVYVDPIENLPDDFIRGVDISSIIVEENSGVVFYNEEGVEQDIFQTLAQNGVNYIRVRVWNNPYDENGNGYGGGNNDTATAAVIGARAAKYGMKLCVDYHYSDFWADPNKQMCPKEWDGMAIEDKSEALYQFTRESLTEIINAGAEVGMVQIGNEINNGLSGEIDWGKRRQLLQAGSRAIREISQEMDMDIQIAVHFTDVSDKSGMLANAQKLVDKEIDYDIFAVSYYTFWHGSMENLTEVLSTISKDYGKKVLIAETSYPYTVEDGDGSGNSVSEGDLVAGYPATQQGQVNAVRDVCAAVAGVGEAGLGVFYWEPAWIPVGVYDGSSADVLKSNQEKWEGFGSGWASSYASEYDPKDAGVYYGGSSWDNQAMFDFEGHPLESLKVFKYLHCGTLVEQVVEKISVDEVYVSIGKEVEMPENVTIIYNDRSTEAIPVEWYEEQVLNIDTSQAGVHEIWGRILDGKETTDEMTEVCCTVNVENFNYLLNPSFEDADTSMWEITSKSSDTTDFQEKESDAYSGVMSLHFWSTSEVSFTVEQKITGLEPGTYEFGLYLQGGDAGDNAEMYIYADNGRDNLAAVTGVSGWCNWQNPVISDITVGEDGTLIVGASISCAAKGWGTLDDFYLYKVD